MNAARERTYVRQAWEGHLRSCAVCYRATDTDGLCLKGAEIEADYEETLEVEAGGTGAVPAVVVERDDITDRYRTPMFAVRGDS